MTTLISRSFPTLLGVALFASACAKSDAAKSDTTTATAPAPVSTANSAGLTPVRGIVASISDSAFTVTTTSGPQEIHIDAPLKVYSRAASDLAHVTPNAFVGITSVAQPDGSERATEIHIFPEELRGTGEGSRMMEQTAAADDAAKPSRMTNGSVASTNATKPGGSRMTNGRVATTGSGTKYTVQYPGGTQTIDIPSDVTVTMIAATDAKLSAGANVIVLARTGADGKITASGVMISAPSPSK